MNDRIFRNFAIAPLDKEATPELPPATAVSPVEDEESFIVPWALLQELSRPQYFDLLRSYRQSYEQRQARKAVVLEELTRFEQLLSDIYLDAPGEQI